MDVVFTWVKPGPRIKKKELGIDEHPARDPVTTTSDYCCELYFAILSCFLFLPIHKIFIVTERPQVPDFIYDFCGFVSVVHHDEFIPITRLPLYNGRAIEAHLAYIDSLSEKFIYFNDDMMLGSVVDPSFYFNPKPIIRTTKRWKHNNINFKKNKKTIKPTLQTTETRSSAYLISNKYVNSLLNDAYEYADRGILLHHATPLTKTILKRAEYYFPDEWLEVSCSKIRSYKTISPIPLASLIGIYEGLADNGETCDIAWHSADIVTKKTLFDIYTKRPRFICINDIGDHLGKEKISMCFNFFKNYFITCIDEEEEKYKLIIQ